LYTQGVSIRIFFNTLAYGLFTSKLQAKYRYYNYYLDFYTSTIREIKKSR
jgi:hypothetical protein